MIVLFVTAVFLGPSVTALLVLMPSWFLALSPSWFPSAICFAPSSLVGVCAVAALASAAIAEVLSISILLRIASGAFGGSWYHCLSTLVTWIHSGYGRFVARLVVAKEIVHSPEVMDPLQ